MVLLDIYTCFSCASGPAAPAHNIHLHVFLFRSCTMSILRSSAASPYPAALPKRRIRYEEHSLLINLQINLKLEGTEKLTRHFSECRRYAPVDGERAAAAAKA